MASDNSIIEVSPLLSDDAFQNQQSRELFNAIDKLRSCGVDRDIELPEVEHPITSEDIY